LGDDLVCGKAKMLPPTEGLGCCSEWCACTCRRSKWLVPRQQFVFRRSGSGPALVPFQAKPEWRPELLAWYASAAVNITNSSGVSQT